MKLKYLFALCGCLFPAVLYAQTGTVEYILKEVENNNELLRSLKVSTEALVFDALSENRLPDPVVEGYYLPYGDHEGGSYTEFQVSQNFEFPTYYGARRSLKRDLKKQAELEYALKRNEILYEVVACCLKLVYNKKNIELERERVIQSQKIFEQVSQLYESDQSGILDLNKARILWMKEKYIVRELENERVQLLKKLKLLNGNRDIVFEDDAYFTGINVSTMDELWADKLKLDPELIINEHLENIAERKLNVAKNFSLPDLVAGYNRQAVAGDTYSGFYGGLSIPLWNNKNKIKAAHLEKESLSISNMYSLNRIKAAYEKLYEEYLITEENYQEFRKTLGIINSEELLFEAYTLGELSFLEYYVELQFYRDANQVFLDLEYNKNQLQIMLLKYKL